MSSLTKLRKELRELRNEHAGKPVGKMTEDEIKRELEHHQLGCKSRVMKENRMKALEKARESRMAKKEAKEEDAVEVKVPTIKKVKKEKEEPKTEHVAPKKEKEEPKTEHVAPKKKDAQPPAKKKSVKQEKKEEEVKGKVSVYPQPKMLRVEDLEEEDDE